MWLVAFLAGCPVVSDPLPLVEDAAPASADVRRQTVRDLGADRPALSTNIGAPCPRGPLDCKPGSPVCVRGLCTLSCVGDNTATPVNEDSCPDRARHVCATVEVTAGKPTGYCLQRCEPRDDSNPCPAGSQTACTPASTGYTGKLTQAVCWDRPCASHSDCPVDTGKICNPSKKNKDCLTGETCKGWSPTQGSCVLAGQCNVKSGLCAAHTLGKPNVAIGAACGSDRDCANDQFCDTEHVDDAEHVVTRNGYCTKSGCSFASTLKSAACPAGSACNRAYFGGLCQKRCTLTEAKTCRGHAADRAGDYECYAWNQVKVGGVALADAPLCDYAAATPCNLYEEQGIECKQLGDASNSTKMACRDPQTHKVLPNAFDPAGVCMDATSSGP